MAHIHEKIDYTVEVFIVYKNKVLLRVHEKYNIWLSVGGHIELDEDPNQAALREVREEVGLTITLDDSLQTIHKNTPEYTELIPPYFINRNRINEKHEHITLTYFATSDTDRIEQGLDEQSSACKWFTREELEAQADILDHIKTYASKALDTLASDK